MLTYEAFIERDSHFDGKIFVGVKTTKIYCLPSCRAKKPKPENVLFFQTKDEAVRSGFRSCKVCFPSLPVGRWFDEGHTVWLQIPDNFSFEECLKFLSRSSNECLHHIEDNQIWKAITVHDRCLLLRIRKVADSIALEFLKPCTHKPTRLAAAEFVSEWFDLFSDITAFYEMAERDIVLRKLARDYEGLRLIGTPDLFEALTWAIIGPRINPFYGYTLKRNFVTRFGNKIVHGDREYWSFPEAKQIAGVSVTELIRAGLTRRKSEYIIHLSSEFLTGSISKNGLLKKDFAASYETLSKLPGVGCRANYVMMRCLRYPSALPNTDVDLRNALKQQLKLKEEPTINYTREVFSRWKGVEAYATFYLWRSLIP
ncbi:MAG TPA: Ada metal-binding domain-containing protein [Pyrinomonadaceae bacterium]|nr:Ada metal-binding domain-containing protein [Pyrinomonadaceae bacterium]